LHFCAERLFSYFKVSQEMSSRSRAMKAYWQRVRDIAAEEGINIAAARRRYREQNNKKSIDIPTVIINDLNLPDYENIKCPYCMDGFSLDEKIYTCKCTTTYHEECMLEFSKCAIIGCKHSVTKAKREQEVRVSSSSEPIRIQINTSSPILPPVEIENEIEYDSGESFNIDDSNIDFDLGINLGHPLRTFWFVFWLCLTLLVAVWVLV